MVSDNDNVVTLRSTAACRGASSFHPTPIYFSKRQRSLPKLRCLCPQLTNNSQQLTKSDASTAISARRSSGSVCNRAVSLSPVSNTCFSANFTGLNLPPLLRNWQTRQVVIRGGGDLDGVRLCRVRNPNFQIITPERYVIEIEHPIIIRHRW
jgi:hypothetical protein